MGEPSEIVQKGDYILINYYDPETNFQRLLLTINKNDTHVLSLLWLPKENESESSLDFAKKSFESSGFLVEEEKNLPCHMVSEPRLFYINKKSGVTIGYDKTRGKVEAIALYDRETRISSSTK